MANIGGTKLGTTLRIFAPEGTVEGVFTFFGSLTDGVDADRKFVEITRQDGSKGSWFKDVTRMEIVPIGEMSSAQLEFERKTVAEIYVGQEHLMPIALMKRHDAVKEELTRR